MSVYSKRFGAELHLGKQPAKPPTSDHVQMADLLNAIPADQLPAIPKNFGHGLAFGQTGWGMDGNGPADAKTKIPAGYAARQGAGCCFWSGTAHDQRELARVNKTPMPQISDMTVINWYSAYGKTYMGAGYDPKGGGNDNGTDPQDGMKMRQAGIGDDTGAPHQIGQTVALEPGNLTQLYYAAWLFEKAGVGVQFQQAQMDQFDAGQPWSYVQGSPVEGGHWIIVMSRTGLISWGERHAYADDWYTKLNDESYAWTDLAQYNRVTGESAEHFKDQDLEKFVVLVAKQKALGAAA